MQYNGKLEALSEDGHRVILADQVKLIAEDDAQARQYLYDHYWDPRLESASCAAVVQVTHLPVRDALPLEENHGR